MAIVHLRKKDEEKPLGQIVTESRDAIAQDIADYDAAREAWQNDPTDANAVAWIKAQANGRGSLGVPAHVSDPDNPDNYERWSDKYKELTGQGGGVDETPPLTETLNAALASSPVQSTSSAKEIRPTDGMYADALAAATGKNAPAEPTFPFTQEEATSAQGAELVDPLSRVAAHAAVSQLSDDELNRYKNTLISAWNARNPVQSTVIDMNKGTVRTDAENPADVWAPGLMGVPYSDAERNPDGSFGIPANTAAPSAEWSEEWLKNGGTIGNPDAAAAPVWNPQVSPYDGGGSAGVTPAGLSSVGGASSASVNTSVPAAQGGGASAVSGGTRYDTNGRPVFEYSLEADPLYQEYRRLYMQNGQRAMENTIARASALTGGYGNSYATAAGQNAYNAALDQLNDVALTLYNTAYGKYRDEMSDWYNDRNFAYQQSRDAVADARYADELAYNRAWNEDERAYDRNRDAVADARYDQQWAYQVAQDEYTKARQAESDYQNAVNADTARAQNASEYAAYLASAGYNAQEIRAALQTMYGNGVEDGALDLYAGQAAETAKRQAAEASARVVSGRNTKSGSGSSASQSGGDGALKQMSATQYNDFSSKITSFSKSGNDAGLRAYLDGQKTSGYLDDEMVNYYYELFRRGGEASLYEESGQTDGSVWNASAGNGGAAVGGATADYNKAFAYTQTMWQNGASPEAIMSYLQMCVSAGLPVDQANELYGRYVKPVYQTHNEQNIQAFKNAWNQFANENQGELSGGEYMEAYRSMVDEWLAAGRINSQDADYLANDFGVDYEPHDPEIIGYEAIPHGGTDQTGAMTSKDEDAAAAVIEGMYNDGYSPEQIAARLDVYRQRGMSDNMYNYLYNTYIASGGVSASGGGSAGFPKF